MAETLLCQTSLVAQTVKRLPTMQETWVRSLGWEDSPGEGNANPLQYSCLEIPMDGGAWWATIHEVAGARDDLATKAPCIISGFPVAQE